MKRLLFSFFILSFIQSSRAQEQTYSISVYFNINEVNNIASNIRIDSLLDLVGNTEISVKLFAYADYLSNEDYNIQLSKKRLSAVKHYIKTNAKGKLDFTESVAYGEKFSKETDSQLGEPSQRRVDVLMSTNIARKKISKQPLNTHQTLESEKSIEDKIKKKEVKKNSSVLQKNISALKEGESLAIEGLSFIPGRHILMKSSVPVLEELLEILKDNTDLIIEIQGHICCMATGKSDGIDKDTGTWNLSETRAEAVYNYLIRNGIEESRLSYKGYGHQFPKVSPERTVEDEQLNRRVEIKVIEN